MNKEEIKNKILTENLSRSYSLNDEIFEMTDAEFEKSINDRVEMEWQQQQILAETQAKRQALLDKLGITEEEAKLLLS